MAGTPLLDQGKPGTAATNVIQKFRKDEVEDFVDFLSTREQAEESSHDAMRISAPTLTRIWNNADYDAL